MHITSKVAFFPENTSGNIISYKELNGHLNCKGDEAASIDLSLKQLGVDYIDLLLVHNPIVTDPEYKAACVPHMFDLFAHFNHP